MNDMSGQKCIASSRTICLQRSLVSRLQENLDLNGSMEYLLTWKRLATPAGRRLFQLRASERHTRENAFTGWPTPTSTIWGSTENTIQAAVEGRTQMTLCRMIHIAEPLAGWPTLTLTDSHQRSLGTMKLSRMSQNHIRQVAGIVTFPLYAQTTKKERFPILNQEFCRWLMGYPERWNRSAPTATR